MAGMTKDEFRDAVLAHQEFRQEERKRKKIEAERDFLAYQRDLSDNIRGYKRTRGKRV